MQTLLTDRLIIRRLTPEDAGFMLDLLNQPSWLRFIGDRGVRNLADAEQYIRNGPMAMYASHGFGFCLVALKAGGVPLGICGLAQRDYLDCPDIGFAFLPQYCGQGYAREAAAAMLRHARDELGIRRIVATTRLDNLDSQRLLEKLGLRFSHLITHPDGDRQLKLYVNGQAAGTTPA